MGRLSSWFSSRFALVTRLGAVVVVSAMAGMLAAPGSGAASASPCGPTAKVPHYKHIVVIAFENHSYESILGSSAPSSYFKTLAAMCGTATDFTSASFPHSLPNYLAVTGGTTGGISGDCLPGRNCRVQSRSIFDQVGGTGWRVWAESMPAPCDGQNATPYVARHNPPLYFPSVTATVCQRNDRAMPTPVPNPARSFTWISPDLQNDLTTGTLSDASTWLKAVLADSNGLLRSKAYTAGNTAIFIWFDSGADTDTASTPIPLIVVAPSVGHRVVSTPLNDYYLLHGWEGLLGQPCLETACTVNGFDKAFRL